jgi:hypothetical protein
MAIDSKVVTLLDSARSRAFGYVATICARNLKPYLTKSQSRHRAVHLASRVRVWPREPFGEGSCTLDTC